MWNNNIYRNNNNTYINIQFKDFILKFEQISLIYD